MALRGFDTEDSPQRTRKSAERGTKRNEVRDGDHSVLRVLVPNGLALTRARNSVLEPGQKRIVIGI